MIFFHQGDCGCSPQSGNATPTCPPVGALISDNRYLSLATSPKGQVIVVPKGSNSQTYLTAAFAGFLVYRGDGEVEVSRTPALTLPILNPAESGSFPLPGGFKYLTAGTGDPAEWRHIAAPTTGTYILHSENGVWILKDAGSIPGIQTIGNSSLTIVKGNVMCLVNIGTDESPVWTVRRLKVEDDRVIVGDIDPITGEQGYRALPAGSFLEHPKGRFPELQARTFVTLDADGNAIVGGLEQSIVTGAGSISDPKRMVYSPTTKRLYLAPVTTLAVTNVATNSALTAPPTSYSNLPGGHGAGVNKQFNYANVRVDFTAGMSVGAASDVLQFGVFRDGVLLQEFDNDNLTSVSICYIDENCPFGAHTYDVRWKKSSGATTVSFRNSYLTVSTLN